MLWYNIKCYKWNCFFFSSSSGWHELVLKNWTNEFLFLAKFEYFEYFASFIFGWLFLCCLTACWVNCWKIGWVESEQKFTKFHQTYKIPSSRTAKKILIKRTKIRNLLFPVQYLQIQQISNNIPAISSIHCF